jgi:hypothetical protein
MHHYQRVIVAGIVGLLASLPVTAQNPAGFPGNTGESITVGPFLFSPAVELKWEDRDNIFFTPRQEFADQIYLARARLMFELPIYESYVRFVYTPQYREFEKYRLNEKWSHFVDFSTILESARGLRFRADYQFVNANLETSEVDPGGELVFADQMFTKNYGLLGIEYWFSSRDGVTVEGTFADVAYDDPDRAFFYDYQRTSARVGWLHQLSPILVMDLSYQYIDFEPENTLFYRTSESDQISIGFRGQFSPVVTTELVVGWRETEFRRTGVVPEFDDYSGPLIQGHIGWELAHGSTLRLDLVRSDYPSNFELNPYYIATGGTLGYELQRDRFFGELWARFQNNDYPLPERGSGEERSDDITTLGLGLGFRFTDLLSLRGGYIYEDRDTLFEYSYTVNMFTLGLVFGF